MTYAYGRRGSNLTTGTKTPHIVTLAQANALHDNLVREKTAKGYQPTGESKAAPGHRIQGNPWARFLRTTCSCTG